MSYLYNVYTHPERGQWGFTAITSEKDVKTAFINARDGVVTLGSFNPIKVGPALQKNLRAGYQKVAQAKYLYLSFKDGAQVGEFVAQHPDLGRDLDGDRVFFVAVPEGLAIAEVVESWGARLNECEGNGKRRDKWLQHCKVVKSYVPVMTGDAHAALLVAHWAKENNLMLVTDKGEIPQSGPSQQRHEWRNFLRDSFDLNDIDAALADLGWPLKEALGTVTPAQPSTTPAEHDEWIALAQQVSF